MPWSRCRPSEGRSSQANGGTTSTASAGRSTASRSDALAMVRSPTVPHSGMEIRVDPRVELMSIVCHLAQTPEYRSFDTPYRRAVDAHFAPFLDHPVIAAMRELRTRFSISYNAPIGLAVFL